MINAVIHFSFVGESVYKLKKEFCLPDAKYRSMARIVGNFAVLVGGALGFAGTVLSNQRVRRIGDCVLFVSQSAMLISSIPQKFKDNGWGAIGIGAFLSIWPSLRPLASFAVRATRNTLGHPVEVDHLKAEARSKMAPQVKNMVERIDALPRDSQEFRRINLFFLSRMDRLNRKCPITEEWIEDPVKIGNVYYERSALLQYIYNKGHMIHSFTRYSEREGLRNELVDRYRQAQVSLLSVAELTAQELREYHQEMFGNGAIALVNGILNPRL